MAFDGSMPRQPLVNRAKRAELARRTKGMKGSREAYDPHCAEVARFTQPRLGLNLTHTGYKAKKGGEINGKLLDPHGTLVFNTLQNGMTTGMSSATMPWFKLTVEDPGLRDSKDVKVWLSAVEEVLYGFFAKSGFYAAQKTSYGDLGVFGTAASIMSESWARVGVVHTLPFGDYWIALDADLVANTMLRRCDLTVIQMVEKFGKDRCPKTVRDQYDRSEYETSHCCWHLIEPNNDRVWGKQDNINMPFRSYYWCDSSEDEFLSISGFEERPFWAPRWDILGNDIYGRSPGMDALPTLRQLQLEALRKTEAIEYINRPPLAAPTALNNTHANLVPRGITTMSNVDRNQFFPIWEVPYQAVTAVRESIDDLRQQASELTFASLFMAITNMQGVQPRNVEEIARRNEEKLTQLGPVIDRNQNEQLRVAVDRAFGICNRAGLLPPPPEELQNIELRVVFIGLLAQMQKAIGIGPIERMLTFVSGILPVDPRAGDKMDWDQTIDEYADRVGAPPSMIRSDEEVAKLRDARQRQEQMAQLAALAPAAKDGAQAAAVMQGVQQANQGPGVPGLV